MEKNLKQARKINEDLLDWVKIKSLLNEKDKASTEEEQQAKANSYEIFWRVYFEKDLKWMISQQLEFMGKNIENNEQLLWIRGIMAGLDLVKQQFESQINVSMSRFNKDNQ
jgi:hypothetical protein